MPMTDKLARLVQVVADKVRNRQLTWESFTEQKDGVVEGWTPASGFQAKLANGVVQVLEFDDPDNDRGYSFVVNDANGKYVDSAHAWAGDEYVILSQLYEDIDRQVRNVDETIDKLLDELKPPQRGRGALG